MAASDIGLVHDGQMVSSATALHLPTLVLFDMRMHHQWYNQYLNRFWNEMNVNANNMLWPEVIGGEVWEGRIAEMIAEWYVKPDTRYEFIRKWEYLLKDSLCYKNLDRSVVRSRDLVLADGQSYDVFQDPFKVVADKLWTDIKEHKLATGNLHDIKFDTFAASVPRFY